MDLRESYNRIAEDWHKDHQDDDWWKEGTGAFVSCLPEYGSVLDVGCGSGTKAKHFIRKDFVVTGIDISENLLAIAARESPEGTFKTLSMTELDSLPDQYDGVFAQASLLHIPKSETADVVCQMAGRTKPGGYVYLAVKQVREGRPDEEILHEDDYGYPYERFFSYYSMEELEAYLKAAGLETVWKDARPTGRTVWLQIIGKKPLA